MAFKHRLYRWFKFVRGVKTWQLLIAIVLLVGASAYFLRQNNLEMLRLRNVVDQADENNGDTAKALLNLQHYVTAHMNTSLGSGVALQHTYERAYQAAVDAAASSNNPNAAIYTQVELECRPVFQRTRSFPAYTACAHDKLSQLQPGQDALANLKTPPSDLYVFNFASPVWSFDFAGLCVLLAIITGLMLIFRILTYVILRAILRTHH